MISASRSTLKLWLPVLVWMALIFLVSAIPNLRSRLRWDHFLRKTAHVLEYAVLAALSARAYRGSGAVRRSVFVSLAVATAVLYAVTDEYHQSFVPHRRMLKTDVMFDAAGALAGSLAYAFGIAYAGA